MLLEIQIPYFFNQTLRLLLLFIQGRHSFSWKSADINSSWQQVTTVRRCQQYARPLSPAVSRGNKLYNTLCPSTSLRCTCIRVMHHVYQPQLLFTSLKAFRLCGYYSRAVSIQGNTVCIITSSLSCLIGSLHMNKCTTQIVYTYEKFVCPMEPISFAMFLDGLC